MKLKAFTEQTWASVMKAANRRKNLTSDKYCHTTENILKCTAETVRYYHPFCHKNYTAVKRPKEGTSTSDIEASSAKTPRVETRTCSVLPKAKEMKATCMFCGRARKKVKGREDKKIFSSTTDGCSNLNERAKFSTNERVQAMVRIGTTPIAQDTWYHKSCRVSFNKETDVQKRGASIESFQSKPTPTACYKNAFTVLHPVFIHP